MSLLTKVLSLGAICLASVSTANAATCKTVPGDAAWPSTEVWEIFNKTLGGQLIKPVALGAICHPDQAAYNNATCATVQTGWSGFPIHRMDPVSSAWENYNNDTCNPYPQYSCNTNGYPAYVVNATCAEHVQLGVAFAALYNIRLIVKALSQLAAGHDMLELYAVTDAVNQTVVGGEAEGVGIGGYLTGSGHSVLSVSYGMAADNVLEVTVVTPSGLIAVANECQNSDLFYAFRGGGGSSFGVLVSATIKTYPTIAYVILSITILLYEADDDYWDIMTYILSQYPYLSNQGISGYPYVLPEYEVAPGEVLALYDAKFHNHNSPYGDSNLTAIFEPIFSWIQTNYGSVLLEFVNTTSYYHTRYEAHLASHDESVAGTNTVLGSRLVSADTLTRNQTALKATIKGFTGTGSNAGSGPFLLGGRGVANAVPRGGSDAVLPAWRTNLAHVTTQAYWGYQNATEKAEVLASMTEQVQYLIDLQPDSGAYVNEANINEPNWQTTFWGTNYPELLAIKKERDPADVFWCFPCVGSEGWEVVGDLFCRV